MPPPVPPSVNEGRITIGKPSSACAAAASSMLWAISERGDSRPISLIALRNFSRSSAVSMASRLAAISSTPNSSSTPSRTRSSAVFSAVCPPIVGSSASGRSFSMMRATVRQLTGSMYTTSAISGSVMIVAGLELTRMTRYPSSRSALQACAPE